MLNNFIYAQTKDLFLEALGAGNILDEAIVFIEDTKEIWNHGHYFGGETIDPSIISDLQTAVAQMQSSKLDSSTAESTYAKKTELPSLDGYLTENVANALYVKVSDMQGISTVISNLQTEISTKVEQSQLNDYVPLDRYESVTQTLSDNIGELNTTKANKATTIAGYGITDAVTKDLTGELETAHAQAIYGGDNAYALPDQANGDEDDVLLSQQSVKTINGEAIYGSGDISTFHYGVCNTAAGTAAKTVTVSGNFSLVTGAQVVVKFTNGNTTNGSTLNVNNTGAKTIRWGSYSGAWYMNAGGVLTFVYDGTNWYCKSSSDALTSGNINIGYNLQTINSDTCGLAISAGYSITSNVDGALYINKGNSSGNNAIYCNGGNIVTQNGFFDGAYAYNTRVLTGSATLNKIDSLVLCNATSSVTITLPSDPIDGQIITFIKPANGTVIFSSSISNLNAPQDDTLNSKTITITSVGVRKLYYINSRWYFFLQ